MKYGKQQWARVASLLNRKSAKQCKARWNEWLDPSVRKVEWSRAEDEKLLHLAKLMPAQWRTIGPLVGRTAGQCQERYERLLDEAATAAGGIAAGSSELDESLDAASSARKLRPGEIDPHPETKPARPDPIDMDEDEIEMLQEARARLANTQGKKAKRKAREKMLNEAKRMADLQKRRELKAAGLLDGQMRTTSRKKNRGIDYGVEIPFHKPAPSGFHSTQDEDVRAETLRNQRLKDVDYKRITESQSRARDREAKERQKREEARIRSLERSNMQYVVAEVARRNDPTSSGIASRKRGVLSMPEPTVDDEELRRVAKVGEEEMSSLRAAGGNNNMGGSGGVTDALLGDYSDRPLPTPMRTPAAAAMSSKLSVSEIIQREAMNLRVLSSGQTPLLGEENAQLLDGGAGTGVELNAASASAAFGSTPMMVDRAGGGGLDDATAGGRSARTNATPLTFVSSHRDELGLNANSGNSQSRRLPSELRSVTDHEDDVASVGGTSIGASSFGASSFGASTFASTKNLSLRELAREERRRAKRARKELEEALANLPAPQFEYELGVPEDVTMEEADEDEMRSHVFVKDKADEEREELERLAKEAERLYEEQCSVMKRGELPRPSGGATLDRLHRMENNDTARLDTATKLIQNEMATLINHDAHSHPILPDKSDPIIAGVLSKGKKDKREKKRKHQPTTESFPEVSLDYFPEEALATARQLLAEEFKVLVQEKRDLLSSVKGVYYEEDADVLNACVAETVAASLGGTVDMSFSMTKGAIGWDESCDAAATLHAEYAALQSATSSLTKACSKLEQKLEIQTGGYTQRSNALVDAALRSFAELQHSRIEQCVYTRLRAHETKGASLRVERLAEEVERLEREEMNKQRKYGELMHVKNRLLLKLNGQGKQKEI